MKVNTSFKTKLTLIKSAAKKGSICAADIQHTIQCLFLNHENQIAAPLPPRCLKHQIIILIHIITSNLIISKFIASAIDSHYFMSDKQTEYSICLVFLV